VYAGYQGGFVKIILSYCDFQKVPISTWCCGEKYWFWI